MSAKNRLVLDGLDDLKEQLRRLPEDLRDEAAEIVQAHAYSARDEIRDDYPARTGDLRSKTIVTLSGGSRFGAAAIVKNTDPLAFIFEHGTQARHTKLGANRGSMPPGNVFIPAVIRWRKKMYDALKSLLAKKGLSVRGDA